MKKGGLSLLALLALLINACSGDGGFTQLESGFAYKLIENEEGRKAVPGDYMMIDLTSVYAGDSVLIERKAADGFGLDPLRGVPDKLKEIFAQCDQGDSIHIKMSLMEYALLTRMPIARGMDTTKHVVMQMRIVEVDNEASIIERRKIAQTAKDEGIIEEYLAEKGLEGTPSADGIYHVVKEEGSGPRPVNGQRVSVNYVLRLTDGTLIDTNYEDVARAEGQWDQRRMPYRPYTFTVGNDNVISGWHLGIPLVKEGGKGTLLIPSALGYGANVQPGDPIPPHAVLVFDVEVVEIKND